MKSIKFGVSFLLCLASAAGAQPVTFEGEVTDAQGAVVVGAEVTLVVSGAPPLAVRTDESGRFEFSDVALGTYTLQVASPGFATWESSILVDGGTPPVSVTLQIGSLVEQVQVSGVAPFTLEEPVPTGSRVERSPLETPASVAVVSGDLIRDLGTATLAVAKSLDPSSYCPLTNE